MFHEIGRLTKSAAVEKWLKKYMARLPVERLKKILPFRGYFSTTGQRRLKKISRDGFISTGDRGTFTPAVRVGP